MRSWRPAGLFGGLLALYCLTITRVYPVNDVVSSSLGAWRIANTGAPWLDGVDYARLAHRHDVWVFLAANDHLVPFRSPGSIAGGVPGYLVARIFGADGWSLVPGGISAAVLTTLALVLLYLALSPTLGFGPCAAVILVLGLTTPVWTVSADAMWTHPVTLLGIAGMAWACVRERWWLVGLFGGVAIWGRLHTALIVAILGLALAWSRRSPRIAVLVGAVSGLFLGLSVLWTHWVYGTWSLAGGYSMSSYTDRATSTSSGSLLDQVVNHLGLWVSPDRGILVWTPVLLVLAPAVVRSWRELPDWSRWLLIGGLAYTLVQGQLNGFSGGSGFFGYRLTLELLMCATPAYALSLAQAGKRARVLLGPIIGLQLGAFAVAAPGQGGIRGEDHLWTQNSYLTALERAPVLAVWIVLSLFLGWAAGWVVRRRLAGQSAAQA